VSCAILIFAKAPVAGQAKTRLIPALGPAGAAALAEKMLRHAVSQALASACGQVVLCVSPDITHRAFAREVAQSGGTLRLTEQGAGDLGQRMDRALTCTLQQHGRAILIGTDAPALDAHVLRAAAHALTNHDAVFVPALDIAWSTHQVMAQTRNRLQTAGLRWAELDPVADIDEPADLGQLPAGWLA
jgi:glycosyltransferase A (GT-A) superfamily protein (DUF2064 family)